MLLSSLGFAIVALGDQTIYTDSVQNSWENWSWDSTIDFNSTAQVHSGSKSAAVTVTAAWGAFYLHHPAFNSSSYASLAFWIHGGTGGGQQLQVQAILSTTNARPAVSIPTLPANTWQPITLSLASLGVAGKPDLDGFWIQDRSGAPEPTFYLDDVTLVASATPPPTVALTAPADGATYLAPTNINLAASVGTNGHTITKVQFYDGAALLGEDAAPPYSLTWSNVGAGSYVLTARLLYDTNSTLDSASAAVSVVSNSPAIITIDALKNRHAISPLIYGVAFAGSAAQLADLNAPAHRSGGNTETRYNWELNAHNHAADPAFVHVVGIPERAGGAVAQQLHVLGNDRAELAALRIAMKREIIQQPLIGAGRALPELIQEPRAIIPAAVRAAVRQITPSMQASVLQIVTAI